jgi:hypothetical protein
VQKSLPVRAPFAGSRVDTSRVELPRCPFVASGTVHDGLFTAVGYGTVHVDVAAPLFLYSLAVLALFAALPVWLGYR